MVEPSDTYPLEQLILIKKRRLEEAEKILSQKKILLSQEQEKLVSLEKKLEQVKDHYKAKLTQLREKLDEGAPIELIQQMKRYLESTAKDLKREEFKVEGQKKNVKLAEEQVRLAREVLFKKQKDVEKLNMHQTVWKKENRYLHERKEGIENDEMGSSKHVLKKIKTDRKKNIPK